MRPAIRPLRTLLLFAVFAWASLWAFLEMLRPEVVLSLLAAFTLC